MYDYRQLYTYLRFVIINLNITLEYIIQWLMICSMTGEYAYTQTKAKSHYLEILRNVY